jgi:hypothetical protein
MQSGQQSLINKVVALAGRRTDASDTNIVRFPLSSVEKVRTELHNLFLETKTNKLVCSAACGADLVALDVAGELGIERHVIIPFSVPEFRRISVTDRPGSWGSLYDKVIADVLALGLLQILGRDSNDDSAFSITNKVIIKQAQLLTNDTKPLAVVIWEGESHEVIDSTREFLRLAQQAKFDEVSIISA